MHANLFSFCFYEFRKKKILNFLRLDFFIFPFSFNQSTDSNADGKLDQKEFEEFMRRLTSRKEIMSLFKM